MAATLLMVTASAALAWGQAPVSAVVFDAPGAGNVATLNSTFGVDVGESLSREEIRQGVQALLASGEVEDVVVSVTHEAHGAVVLVSVQVASRVSSIQVLGLPRRARRQVLTTLGMTAGGPLRVPSFERALLRAERRLRDDGYPDASLVPELHFDLDGGTVAVRVSGKMGSPLPVRRLTAEGSELPPGELWRRCDVRPGDRLTVGVREKMRRRLAESLRGNGYWEAEVEPPEVTIGKDGASVLLTVKPGPRYRLELRGLERDKALEQQALPFLRGEEAFSEAGLDLTERRVRMFLQREGHLRATASGAIEVDGTERVLRLDVDAGPRTPITAVRFPGLTTLPESQVRERMGVRQGRPWRWGREAVDDDALVADATSLLATLQEAGLADAVVEGPRIVAEEPGVAVEFVVIEGERRVVGQLSIEGFPADLPLPKLALVVGGPWSEAAEADAREALEDMLLGAGYLDARASSARRCGDGVCDVDLRCEPGPRVELARLVVAGLGRTRRGVVEKVARLKTGAVLGNDEQVDAERRLLALGIFQRAAIRPIRGQATGERRGMVLDLREGPTRGFAFGLGWDTVEKARVSALWSELSLFGAARILSAHVRFSARKRHLEANFRDPAGVGVLRFPLWISVYRTEESFDTYDLLRRGTWVELGDRERRPLRTLLRYDYQIVDPDAPDEILSDLERENQRLAVASVTPILEWDSRDDLFSPRSGSFASVQLQMAFKLFLSDATFDKLTTSLATFTPVGDGAVGVSLRAGAVQPRPRVQGSCDLIAAPEHCANLALPISVRFFAGGRVTHRAFATDRLGIRGQTLGCPDGAPDCTAIELEPVGGAAQLLASLEWRFPVFGVVGGALFMDAGNVWSSWRNISPEQVRWGAGLGLRVETPVGPVRLEFGWKLDRERGESPGELFLSFGNPF